MPLNKNAEEMLVEFLEFCKQKVDTNVLFVRFPHLITNTEALERGYRCNAAGKIIKDYGFEFLNLETNYNQIKLDINHDFYNEDHLNVFGAEKLTSYLGKILIEKYNFDSCDLTRKQREEWEDSVSAIKKVFEKAKQNIANGKAVYLLETYDFS